MKTDNIVLDKLETSTYENYTIKTMYVKVRGNIWRISLCTGDNTSYVELCKITNNPYGGRLGKEFPTWYDALQHYKSAELQTAIKLHKELCRPPLTIV